MKTYPLSTIAKKMHAWHYTAEKYLAAHGVTPIHTKAIDGFGTYKTYAACDADPVIRQYKLEKAQKQATKLQKEAKKAAKKVAKATPKAKAAPAPQEAPTSNDEAILAGLRHLYVAITALTKAVEKNTQTISENGLAALEVATRPAEVRKPS
jgi:maltooligosyltrehalose synthase